MKKFLLGALLSASMLVGCKGDVLVVGGTDDASTPAVDSDAALPVGSDAGSTTGHTAIPKLDPIDASAATVPANGTCGFGCTPPPGYDDTLPDSGAVKTYDPATAQVFTGYLENFKFPSGSDHVLVAVTPDGTAGTVFFGDGPTVPPPSSPDVAYPPGATTTEPLTFLERFPFSVLRGSRAGDRVTFDVNAAEVEKQWCEIQATVYPQCQGTSKEFFRYSCLPSASSHQAAAACDWWDACGTHPVDCVKLQLCLFGSACSCSSHGCTVDVSKGTGGYHFDLRIQGNLATGSVSGLATSPVPVHLTAAP